MKKYLFGFLLIGLFILLTLGMGAYLTFNKNPLTPNQIAHINQIRPQLIAVNREDVLILSNGAPAAVIWKIPLSVEPAGSFQISGGFREDAPSNYSMFATHDGDCLDIDRVIPFDPRPESEWTRLMGEIRAASADPPAQQ